MFVKTKFKVFFLAKHLTLTDWWRLKSLFGVVEFKIRVTLCLELMLSVSTLTLITHSIYLKCRFYCDMDKQPTVYLLLLFTVTLTTDSLSWPKQTQGFSVAPVTFFLVDK